MSVSPSNLKGIVVSYWGRLQGQGVGAVLVRGASGSFGVMLLGAALAFGINILLARVLGVSQYGIYVYALTWINLLSLFCKLGMDTSLLRFVPAYSANEEWSLLRGILGRSVQYVLVTSSLIALLASVVVWYLSASLGTDQAKTLWIAFLILPLLGLIALRSAVLRAYKHVVKAALPESIFQRLIIALLASLFYLYTKQNLQASQVMVFNLLGTLFAFYIGTIWLIKVLPQQLRDTKPSYEGREWIKVSLPLFFMSGMSLILNQTGIIMVGSIMDAEQTGVYAVANRIANLVIFGLIATNAIVAPMISELYSTGQYHKLQRMITLAARGIGAFTIICSIFLVLFGKFVLGLFGEGFVVGYTILIILLAGQMVNALAGSVGFLMTMTGHQNQAAQILGVSAAINIVLNILLIPAMGLIGAAIATATTTTLWNVSMLIYVRRRLNINPTIFARI